MKYKYLLIIVLTVILLSAVAAALAQQRTSGEKIYLLKGGGETIAELRVRGGVQLLLNASRSGEYDPYTGRMNAKGGLRLSVTVGTNSVSVQAAA
jgi:hypothetical protein